MTITQKMYDIFIDLFTQSTGERLKEKGYTINSFVVGFDSRSNSHLITLVLKLSEDMLPIPEKFNCAVEDKQGNVVYYKAIKDNDKAYSKILKSLAVLDRWIIGEE